MSEHDDNHPEFSVYWWDATGGQHTEMRFVLAEKAVKASKRLTEGPAAQAGMVVRVLITDGGDMTVFEWKKGQGIVWPRLVVP